MEMFNVDSIETALEKMRNGISNITFENEKINILDGINRVLAEDIFSDEDIPAFNRSVVDGYAVVAKDLFGASESLPTFLSIIGEVEMGKTTDLSVKSGQAVYVPTGGMLPQNADAMVMIEYVEVLDKTSMAVYTSVAPGSGIMGKGEDMGKGNIVLKKGTILRSQEIGVLAAVGITEVNVKKKPKMAIFSTGDEIIKPSEEQTLGKIRDINSYVVSSMAKECGAEVLEIDIIKDDYETLKDKVRNAMKNCDIVIMSGGSSVGVKDMSSKVIEEMGKPGILTHGIAIKPGKPTIIGVAQNKLLIGLPGHPSSASIVFLTIVKPAIEMMLGQITKPKLPLKARLETNIHAAPGRRTYQMVDVIDAGNELIARPIQGKSGSIMLLSNAIGYVIIHESCEGIEKDAIVEVFLF